MHRAFVLLLLAAPCVWAVGNVPNPAACDMTRQTEYTCNDGTMEGYFYLTDVGEGFANRFTPAVYPSKVEAVTIAAYYSVDRAIQSCTAFVWADAGGQPGAVLWSGAASFDVTAPEWFVIPVTGDVVIASGSFWIGYLDDGSLSWQSPYDDPDACSTYYYYPAAGSWMPLAGLGYPYGVYLGALLSEGVPVELASFDASVTDGGVRLTWRTLSETDCFGFHAVRSRSAEDAGTMLEGSFVAGAGTSSIPHDYGFLDTTVSPGTWFYRLIQTDIAGTQATYGPVRVVYAPGGPTTWGQIKSEFNR